jgi:hypothetical protein
MKPETVVDLLAQIRKRPGMFVGKRSAIRVHVFLQGWLLGKGTAPDVELIRGFQDWIVAKFNITSSHSWAEIITFFSEGDVDAFEEFYSLYDEFMSNRP